MVTPKKRGRIPLDAFLLGIAFFLAISASSVLSPLLPKIQQDFGITLTAAGLLVSSFNFARLALDLPAGFLGERVGQSRLAIAGFVLLILGGLIAGLGPGFAMVVVGRIGMGLGCSILSLVVLSALSVIAPPGARASVLALYPMANNTAISLFPLVGAGIASLWGWRSTMLLCAGLACLSALLMARILPRYTPPPASGKSKEGPRASFRPGWKTYLAMGVVCFGALANMLNRHGFRNTALPLFAAHQLGLNPVQIATGVSVIALTGLVVAIPGGYIADRWSTRGVISVGLVVIALGDLTFLHATNYLTFLLSAFILGSGDFFSSSQTAVLTEGVPLQFRSRALGAYRFAVDLGAAIGPVLLASILQFSGFVKMILVVASILLLAAVTSAIAATTLHPASLARATSVGTAVEAEPVKT